jgi:RimJ/RimL family protein N-acetyltransferase
VRDADLPSLFEHQRDPEANHMAAFPARGWEAFVAHWDKIRTDATTITQTIIVDGQVAGNIGSWVQDGEREVGYWLGRAFWGHGIATAALGAFLHLVTERPLHARVAAHNVASLRVLEKCGFRVVRTECDPAGDGVDEIVLMLGAGANSQL